MDKKMHGLKKVFLLLAVIVGAGGIGWYYTQHAKGEGIYAYNTSIDRSFIIDVFKDNWYWLISDYSLKDYSVEYMLDNRASSQKDPLAIGTLTIKTYRIGGKPVGFIIYYPEELLVGRILFLGVDKAYRSKGLAQKMMNYAMDDLKRGGATKIRLNTRADNEPGKRLYTRMGFDQVWTDGAYLLYEKKA